MALINSIYVGNILNRSLVKDKTIDSTNVNGDPRMKIIKENAVLYKTKKGGYVDIKQLLKKSDYRKADRVILEDGSEYEKNGNITIMPAVSISEVQNKKIFGGYGLIGLFVDKESLKKYNLAEDEMTKEKKHFK